MLATATALLVGSTDRIAHQDIVTLIFGPEAARWKAQLTVTPLASSHAQTNPGAGDAVAPHPSLADPTTGLAAIETARARALGPVTTPPRVVREGKADRLLTEVPMAPRRAPAAGQIFQLPSIIADEPPESLPRAELQPMPWTPVSAFAAFVPRAPDPSAVAVASADALDHPMHRARLAAAPSRLLAATPESPVLGFAPTPEAQGLVNPFASLLRTPSPTIDDAYLLRRRSVARATHPWFDQPLPASVHSEREQRCLAEGIYFESRGESERGQAAVAQVILNRVKNPTYPDTICGVVYQNASWFNRCQFSFACDRLQDLIRDARAWSVAQRVARAVTEGEIYVDEVADSTHYHATYVAPPWRRQMIRLTRIGVHIFYRTRGGGWI